MVRQPARRVNPKPSLSRGHDSMDGLCEIRQAPEIGFFMAEENIAPIA